jgi:hypothetical protein
MKYKYKYNIMCEIFIFTLISQGQSVVQYHEGKDGNRETVITLVDIPFKPENTHQQVK